MLLQDEALRMAVAGFMTHPAMMQLSAIHGNPVMAVSTASNPLLHGVAIAGGIIAGGIAGGATAWTVSLAACLAIFRNDMGAGGMIWGLIVAPIATVTGAVAGATAGGMYMATMAP